MSTVRVLLCMLGLCLQSCSSQAEEPPVVSEAMNTYYTRQNRISDVMERLSIRRLRTIDIPCED